MPYDRTAAVARARRAVHRTHALAATYKDSTMVEPVSLSVGRFNRLNLQGDMVETGYANVVEGIDRVRFNSEELAEKSVVLRRGGVVTLTDPLEAGTVLVLDHLEPITGPINMVWVVSKNQ